MSSRMRTWFGLLGVVFLTLIACGGNPDQAVPEKVAVSREALGDPRGLTLSIAGPGTVNVSADGVALPACSASCIATIAEGAEVTLTGATANFIGFQRPYCEVNACNWDDPEFLPPAQNAWSPAPYVFTMVAAKTVNAKFGATAVAPTVHRLTLNVAGAGNVVGSYAGAAGDVALFGAGCAAALCTADVPAGAVVTLMGGASGFVGFQRKYCEVNFCDWDDPEFLPPPYAWSLAPYTFTMAAPKVVNAKFMPPPPTVYVLTLGKGPGAGLIDGTVNASPIVWTPACTAAATTCTAQIPAGAVVTLTGSGTKFVGFQRPYCEVNECDWDDDPEFHPPSPTAWSPDPFTFTMTGGKSVAARFTY